MSMRCMLELPPLCKTAGSTESGRSPQLLILTHFKSHVICTLQNFFFDFELKSVKVDCECVKRECNFLKLPWASGRQDQ